MEILHDAHLKVVAGASGAYDPAYAEASARQSQHGGYGGQANGFVGTNSCGLDLSSIIRDNPCATGIIAGAISGAGSLPGMAKGIAGGALTGCVAGGNGNGGGSGSNYGGQCTW